MKKTTTSTYIFTACLFLGLSTSHAEGYVYKNGYNPAVVFGDEGIYDRGFNQMAYDAITTHMRKHNSKVTHAVIKGSKSAQMTMQLLSQRGANPLITIGFSQEAAFKKAASLTPNKHFIIVDAVVNLPNVTSIVFKEHEGSFIVGALAAMKSTKGKIGFIGGKDMPLIRNFACGYKQGAKYVNPSIKILSKTVGEVNGISPWNNKDRGQKLGTELAKSGADVLFAAAGGTGSGVYKAAKDAKIYAIGVDKNQNYMIPGTMLTSMVKRIDAAMEKILVDAQNQKLETGVISLGLKEGAVGWALDEHNRDIITEEMELKIKQIQQDIIDGKIKIHDYRTNNKCPIS